MPRYAILGGTGNTGSALVKQLATEPSVSLNVYARSQEKLLKAHPILSGEDSRHQIFTGSLSDVDLFAKCITGTEVVYAVVGTNENQPGLHIAQDLARVIVDSMKRLRGTTQSDGAYKPPTVVFTTSAGMARNEEIRGNFPAFLTWMGQRVGKYIFEDFRGAIALFQAPENAWIPVIWFCPPGIMPGPSMGQVTIGARVPKDAPVYVTYTDMASAMILSADQADTWVGKEVGMVGAKMPSVQPGIAFYYLTTGLLCVYFPPLWRFGKKRGWWATR